jgi:hypothetical protein
MLAREVFFFVGQFMRALAEARAGDAQAARG